MRTRTVLTTLSVLTAFALAGCGSSADSEDAKVLSKAELKSSLIALDDLGPGFEVDDSADDDDDDTDLGCLNGLDELDKKSTKPTRDEEASYQADSDLNLPAVFTTVGTFRSDATAAKVLSELGDAVADCTEVDVTDKDGFRLQLEVTSNTDKVDPDASGQLSIEAVGKASTQGVTFPFALRFSAIRLGNQVTVVGYVNSTEALGAEADALLQRAFDRLAPVSQGEKVPDLEPLDLKVVQLEDILGGSGGQA